MCCEHTDGVTGTSGRCVVNIQMESQTGTSVGVLCVVNIQMESQTGTSDRCVVCCEHTDGITGTSDRCAVCCEHTDGITDRYQ